MTRPVYEPRYVVQLAGAEHCIDDVYDALQIVAFERSCGRPAKMRCYEDPPDGYGKPYGLRRVSYSRRIPKFDTGCTACDALRTQLEQRGVDVLGDDTPPPTRWDYISHIWF